MRRAAALLPVLALALAGCGGDGPPPAPRAVMVSPVPPSTTPPGIPSGATPNPASHPAGSLYAGQLRGYDASYPQCAAGRPPAEAAFAVIGVNSGKSFTGNPCLGRLWREARPPRALYVNSGLNPDNYSKASADCQELGRRLGGPEAQQRAYAIGCGEAVAAQGTAREAGVDNPDMWWIDVEASNSWDELDLNLNRFALQGQVDQLAALGKPVGVYSTFREWALVTGNWTAPGVGADWVAGLPPAVACAGVGFSGAPVWLAQEAGTWPGLPYDSDWAC